MILPTFSSFEIMLIVSEKVNNLSTQKKPRIFSNDYIKYRNIIILINFLPKDSLFAIPKK